MRLITSFKQYVELALVTESIERYGRWQVHIPDDVFRVNHALTGLATEIGELVEAVVLNDATDLVNLHEEIGDVWWYLAIAAHELGMVSSINHICDTFLTTGYSLSSDKNTLRDTLLSMTMDLGNGLDVIKRRIYYNADDTSPKASWGLVGSAVAGMIPKVLDLVALTQGDLKNIWAINIDKLAKRYPNKFNAHDALHRDEDAERKVLEQ